MLKRIPAILPPALLSTLCAMGHGDEIVLADGNFPAESQGIPVIRCDGHGVPELLRAILKLFPLDSYVEAPVVLMDIVAGDTYQPIIWDTYKSILADNGCAQEQITHMERYAFYERARKAFAVVATGEMSQYANVILKKGIVKPEDVDC
ncbi:MAG: L-fucose mutarotase [Firmicutes bacterium]|nr:L-fucose mutarotase [Bacillota bacterium]